MSYKKKGPSQPPNVFKRQAVRESVQEEEEYVSEEIQDEVVDELEDDDPYSSFDSTPTKKKFDSFIGFKPPNKDQEKDISEKTIEVEANLVTDRPSHSDLKELAEVEIQSDADILLLLNIISLSHSISFSISSDISPQIQPLLCHRISLC